MLICFAIGGFNAYWTYFYADNYRNVIVDRYDFWIEGLLTVGTLFVLTSSIIPISLIISLEVVKFVQAWFINGD